MKRVLEYRIEIGPIEDSAVGSRSCTVCIREGGTSGRPRLSQIYPVACIKVTTLDAVRSDEPNKK